ncbi:unnamed protein product [Cuscuta campestris]|uniref:DUF7733 domain-containing protein n=1 Tax=Cuscuta campestris TaxID=132261 RepID=A0A484LH52_9ASTE|nr:unnamed protein product [Cuscuta campestris]
MASLVCSPYTRLSCTLPHVRRHHPNKSVKHKNNNIILNGGTFPKMPLKLLPVCCSNPSSWEPAPYALKGDDKTRFLEGTASLFDTMIPKKSEEEEEEEEEDSINKINTTESSSERAVKIQYFQWPMWLVGPVLLLATGVVPTLWLPISSVFLGPNIASLLSLTGLDCIYNLGATLFLLLAHSCAQRQIPTQNPKNAPPLTYRLWNMFASIVGLMIPVAVMLGSQKGLVQPHLPLIPSAVLLGPYLLLLSIQMLTELLTWHWQSPVWLVTPVVYEGYRLLQLMRGLKLGAELSVPSWMLHTTRGLVCWWVLILGVQLMAVAWYAGFAASSDHRQKLRGLAAGNSN